MTQALAILQSLGLRARLLPDGRLQVGPRDQLTPEYRELIRARAGELRLALGRFRVWRVTLADGTQLTAIRPTGATLTEVLEHEHAVFGERRVAHLEPDPMSAIS